MFVVLVSLTGGVVGACALGGLFGGRLRVDEAAVALAVAILCAEAFPVNLIRRGGSESFDVSSAFALAAVVTVGPVVAVAIQLVARSIVEIGSRRPAIKGFFNVSQKVLALAAAGAVASAVGGELLTQQGLTARGSAAFLAASFAFVTINGLLVTVVCALAAHEPVMAFMRRELLRNGVNELLLVLIAPVAVAIVVVEPYLMPLLAVPIWALWRSGREAATSYHQARYDLLTGLPNRVKLREDLETRFSRLRRDTPGLALIIVGVDRFKEVNDTLGHEQGDRLLAGVASRLAEHVDDAITLGRLQGDEFALLLEGNASRALAVAGRLVEASHAPIVVEGLKLELGVSAGAAVTEPGVDSPDELLRRSNVALCAAKSNSTRHALYDPARDNFSRTRLSLMGDLRRAITDGEVRPYFQPQIDLSTGLVVGAEALVRWTKAGGTLVPPVEFIPQAETTGVIRPLTLAVLRGALDARRTWAADGLDLRVAVNLSARSLLDPALIRDVEQMLEEAEAAPDDLELEVTESAIMLDPERARRTLERLHNLGVHLAIDDFGTGYSSLAYLSRLPVDTVKVDRSFVGELERDPAAELIVRMTVDLGHKLGLSVVAEGVEDVATRDRLHDLGCDRAQGFLWTPAVPPEHFRSTVAELLGVHMTSTGSEAPGSR